MMQHLRSLFQVRVIISTLEGEKATPDSAAVFDEQYFPLRVASVIMDSAILFNVNLDRLPQNAIRIELDFTKPPVVDFRSSPSAPTPNGSFLVIIGESVGWVQGSHKRVMDYIKTRQTKRRWWHATSTYDALLWLLIVPASLFPSYRLVGQHSADVLTLPGVFVTFLCIYIFLVIANVFRALFSYGRWAFPYLQLDRDDAKEGMHRHQWYFGLLAVALHS